MSVPTFKVVAVFKSAQTEQDTMASGSLVAIMDMVESFTRMETFTSVDGKTISFMGWVSLRMRMETHTRANGKMD